VYIGEKHDVSEEHIAAIFREEVYVNQETRKKQAANRLRRCSSET
jgi:hypothetical protein